MSSTVQSQLLKFALAVDPRTKDDVIFTLATIGVEEGDKHPKQRLLDMYNDARMLAAFVISQKKTERQAQEACQNVVRNAAASISAGVLAKPNGYIFRKSLFDSTGRIVSLLNIDQLPFSSRYEALNNPIMYEEDKQFRSPHGNTYVPDGANYLFLYVGVLPFTLADVTGASIKETFSPMYEPLLIQLAVAVESLQGQKKLLSVAEQLLGGS